MELDELLAIVADLRGEGSDIAEVEVKRAFGAFPASIGPTLSAFANLPGGGTVIFGPDENDDFRAAGVYDVAGRNTRSPRYGSRCPTLSSTATSDPTRWVRRSPSASATPAACGACQPIASGRRGLRVGHDEGRRRRGSARRAGRP